MIITVTMNPAIDKTAEIENLQVRALNRLENIEKDIGGKGINVSKSISALGGRTIACGFLAGEIGQEINKSLSNYNVESDFVFVAGETRTNLKLVEKGGYLTEFNEVGPIITSMDIEKLSEKLESYASPNSLFIFAGSVNPGLESDIYKKLILRVKSKGAKAFLDADGTIFAEAIEAFPDIIKPNVYELSQYFGKDEEMDERKIIDMGKQLIRKGIKTVCISRGRQGALFLQDDKVFKSPGLEIEARSSVGAGDALVAAFSYGIEQGKDLEECIRLGMATSAGAAMTMGTKPPSGDVIERLMKKVVLYYL